MKPEEIAELILEGHRTRQKDILDVEGFRLELQLDYSGLMAKGAYKGWKEEKNRGRRKVGCFDFKIFRIDSPKEKSLEHEDVIRRVFANSSKEAIEKAYVGEDPWEVGQNLDEKMALQEAQLTMLEQEINWGDEPFQSWTHFPPSKGKMPRDYIMAYLRRIFEEPDFLERTIRMRAASGTRNVLPPPLGREWKPFREPRNSIQKPWISGELLNRFRKVSEEMLDNLNNLSRVTKTNPY